MFSVKTIKLSESLSIVIQENLSKTEAAAKGTTNGAATIWKECQEKME